MVEQLDARLDNVLGRWRQALRANLGSETARRSLQAMTPAERQPIEYFLAQADDCAEIPAGFVTAATQALYGITAVTLSVDGIIEALKAGGLPSTQDELKRRFADCLAAAMRGHDARNTRLSIDS